MVKQGRGGRIIGASSLAGKTGMWVLARFDFINDPIKNLAYVCRI